MQWTKLNFGKHKGKTLPQIIFIDADWFFWAYENNVFKKNNILKNESNVLYKRTTHIKPPLNNFVKHFINYDNTSFGFSFISKDIAKSKYSEYLEDNYFDKDYENFDNTYFTIKKNIDLSFPRQQKVYDKKGYKNFIKQLKNYIFDGKRATKDKTENFFNNINNFSI